MTLASVDTKKLFGSNLVAMVTPMNPDRTISPADLDSLVDHLLQTGCDGLVVGGTTGESPTLGADEATGLIRQVVARVAGRATVIAGVGSNDTSDSVARARAAENAGADGLLLVCPYYSRPTQAGIAAHCRAVADATALPVMLYDVPARTGTAFAVETLLELSEHPRIRAVKDAKGDLFEAMTVMAAGALDYYCGIDELNLPYLACGAVGVVSVVGNLLADRNAELIAAVDAGDLELARRFQVALLPITAAIMRTSQGAIMAKAALLDRGIIGSAAVRLPLLESPEADLTVLSEALAGFKFSC